MYWMNVDTGNVLESDVEPMGEWIEIDQDEFESLAHPLTLTRREHDAAQQSMHWTGGESAARPAESTPEVLSPSLAESARPTCQ